MNLATDPRYHLLREEVDKLGALAGATVDWPRVAHLAADLTQGPGLDLQVLAYGALARVRLEGPSAAALGPLREALVGPGPLTPARPRARASALEWLLAQLLPDLTRAPPDADAASLADALRRLRAAAREALGDLAPSFSPILAAADARVPTADSSAPAPLDRPAAPPASNAEPVSPTRHSPAPRDPAQQPVPPSSSSIPPTSSSDARPPRAHPVAPRPAPATQPAPSTLAPAVDPAPLDAPPSQPPSLPAPWTSSTTDPAPLDTPPSQPPSLPAPRTSSIPGPPPLALDTPPLDAPSSRPPVLSAPQSVSQPPDPPLPSTVGAHLRGPASSSDSPPSLAPAPPAPSAPRPSSGEAPPPLSAELDADLQRALEALGRCAHRLRDLAPTDPRPIRLLRAALWHGLHAPPRATTDRTTGLVGLSLRDREHLADLDARACWPALLARSENLLVHHRLALDLQRHSARALASLGAASAELALRAELAAFLTRLPDLPDLRDRDGVPLADPHTRRWLLSTVLPPTPACDDDDLPPDLAARLAGRERPAALAEAQRRIATSPSGRVEWRRRLALAEACEAVGDPLADLLFASLVAAIGPVSLADHDPELAARCLAGLLRRTPAHPLAPSARERLAVLDPAALGPAPLGP